VVGARLGVGKPDASHFHIIGVYGRDTPPSASDSSGLDPAESFTLTPSLALALLDGALKFEANVTGSVFTADHTSRDEGVIDVPPAADLVVTPTFGTRIDFAGEFSAAFQRPAYGLTASFTRVQPGFESLALQQIRSDEQTIRLAPRVT